MTHDELIAHVNNLIAKGYVIDYRALFLAFSKETESKSRFHALVKYHAQHGIKELINPIK